MSIYKIGLLAIIFLVLNLLLVNIERVALKIRDFGYSHFRLGQSTASLSMNGGAYVEPTIVASKRSRLLSEHLSNGHRKINQYVEEFRKNEVSSKFMDALASDLMFLYDKNKDAINKVTSVPVNGLEFLKTLDKIRVDIVNQFPETMMSRLLDQTMQREAYNIEVFKKNISMNLEKDLAELEIEKRPVEEWINKLAKFLEAKK